MPKNGKPNTENDFWSRVHIPDDIGECWLWTGKPSRSGYGMFCMNYHNTTAHRWSYIFTYGGISRNLEADHLCKNKLCVNPMHLDPVTHVVNNRRSNSVAGQNFGKAICKNGHEFTEANTYRYMWGDVEKRQCRTCSKTLKTPQENVV